MQLFKPLQCPQWSAMLGEQAWASPVLMCVVRSPSQVEASKTQQALFGSSSQKALSMLRR